MLIFKINYIKHQNTHIKHKIMPMCIISLFILKSNDFNTYYFTYNILMGLVWVSDNMVKGLPMTKLFIFH